MLGKAFRTFFVFSVFIWFSCGGGNIDTGYSDVEGSIYTSSEDISPNSIKDISYILAATYVNNEPVFVSGAVDYAGNFQIKLLTNKTYSFVFYDNKLKPIAYVRRGDKNAIYIDGGKVKIDFKLVDKNYDGYPDYAIPILDGNFGAKLVKDDRFSRDRNFNDKPDTFETDKNKNKTFDGIEDKNKDGYPDSIEDKNKNDIPDVLEKIKEKEEKKKDKGKEKKDKKKKDKDDEEDDDEEDDD